jgi:hypothetical protein
MIIPRLKSKSFLWPTLLWLAFALSMLLLLQSGPTKYDSLMRTLIQWDARLYLSIARDGYEMFPCDYDPSYICGNVGWFPMYPLVGSIVGSVGLDHRWAVLGLSWLALWLALLLMYRLVAMKWGDRVALFSLVFMLLFPASLYFLTAFPYALFLVLVLLVFYLLETKRYAWLALPCACLAVTYPSGIVVTLPLVWVLVSSWGKLSSKQRLSLIAAVAAVGSALLLYCLYYWYRFDDFFLYLRFQSQSYYAHQATFPLWTIGRSLVELPWSSPVGLMLLFTIATSALFYSRKLPGWWQAFMFGLLLFTPTVGTTDCYYRHILVAFPMFVMVALAWHDPRRRWLLPAYVVACLILMLTTYLPSYRAGGLM